MVWHTWGQATRRPGLAPLVLLYGGSGSWMHWLRNIPALAASGCWALVPDLPGFGDSAAWPSRAPMPTCCSSCVEQGLAPPAGSAACDLVGFSFGGMVAGFLAERFLARAARVVLVGAPGLGVAPERAGAARLAVHITDAGQRDEIAIRN